MKRERKAEIHYYEWSVARWLGSSTRDRLDAAGRAIYREMLDRCYVQGSVPYDFELLAKITAATPEEIERNWATIRSHFQQHPRDKSLLVNKHANVYRKQFFRALKQSRTNGERGGRPTATQKPSESKEMGTTRFDENNPKRKGKERIRPVTGKETQASAAKTAAAAWPMAAAAVRNFDPATDDGVILEIIDRSVEVYPRITDKQLSEGIKTAIRSDQRSGALFLETVPEVIRSWRRRVEQTA